MKVRMKLLRSRWVTIVLLGIYFVSFNWAPNKEWAANNSDNGNSIFCQFKENYADMTTVAEIQELLEKQQALIHYMVTEQYIYSLVVTEKEYQIIAIKKDFPLDQWVNDLHRTMCQFPQIRTAASFDQSHAEYVTTALRLHNKLVRPLGSLPEKLVIIPEGNIALSSF